MFNLLSKAIVSRTSKAKNRTRRKPTNLQRQQLESLEDRRLMTADPIEFQTEIPVVVDDLAAMVQTTNPHLVQEIQNTDPTAVLEFSEQVHEVDPAAWAQIVDDTLPVLGPVLGASNEAHDALTDLVVLEFIDIENESAVATDLIDLLAGEVQAQCEQENTLPPQFEQLRQELGDEQFAEFLHSNKEQFGSLQGVDPDEIAEHGEEAIEQFEAVEDALEDWLVGTDDPVVLIGSEAWTVDPFDLSGEGATDKALPWINLNTFVIEFNSTVVLQGDELELIGTRTIVDGPDVTVPMTFMGQDGNVGIWVFEDLTNGYYRVDLPASAPISFSVLAGNGSETPQSEGSIDFADFAGLATTFGSSVPEADVNSADYNGDGVVGFGDFSVLATNFGAELPPIEFAPGPNFLFDVPADDVELTAPDDILLSPEPPPEEGEGQQGGQQGDKEGEAQAGEGNEQQPVANKNIDKEKLKKAKAEFEKQSEALQKKLGELESLVEDLLNPPEKELERHKKTVKTKAAKKARSDIRNGERKLKQKQDRLKRADTDAEIDKLEDEIEELKEQIEKAKKTLEVEARKAYIFKHFGKVKKVLKDLKKAERSFKKALDKLTKEAKCPAIDKLAKELKESIEEAKEKAKAALKTAVNNGDFDQAKKELEAMKKAIEKSKQQTKELCDKVNGLLK